MASKAFVLFVMICVVGSIVSETLAAPYSPTSEVRKCVPGKKYFDGCNTCICHSPDAIGCTLVLCTNAAVEVQKIAPPPDFWQT